VTSFLPAQHNSSFVTATLLGLLRPEHGGITIFRNVVQYTPNYTASLGTKRLQQHRCGNFGSRTKILSFLWVKTKFDLP